MKFRNRINLVTMSDVNDFSAAIAKVPGRILLTDDNGCSVSARSQLGLALASLEWDAVYVISETDIASSIMKWII